MLAVYLAVFVAVLGFSLIAPIFPLYVRGLGASYTLLGVVISTYGAVQLVTQIPSGRLSDSFGRRRLILAGIVIFGLMPPLYLYAKDATFLILVRAIGGIRASLVWPSAMALAIDHADRGTRGKAMGWYNAAFYSALAVGPVMGGALYDRLGLAAPFYFWTLLSALSFVLVLVLVKDPPKIQTPSVDRSRSPSGRLIQDGFKPTFLACCGVVVWTGVVGGFNVTLLPEFALRLGFSTIEIGLLYMAFAGSNAISAIYFGGRADQGSRKILIIAGSVTGVVSFLFLRFVEGTVPVMLLLACLGLGSGMSNPAAAAVIADVTTPTRRGEIFGIFNTARMVGVVVGPMVAGLTADAYGINGSLAAFLAIGLVIAAGTLALREPPPP